jgi:hypothetical protein
MSGVERLKTGTAENRAEYLSQITDFGGKGGTRTLDPGIMSAVL